MTTTLPPFHTVPSDLSVVLSGNAELKARWQSLTPKAKNEWICWVTIVKKPETRAHHLERLKAEVLAGKRRPCCWPGCPHQRPAAAKWFRKR